MGYFVYIIYSPSTDKFYIGQTCDTETRLSQHNSGFYPDCATKNAKDWEHFYLLPCLNREQAIKIERHIKKMRKRKYYFDLKTHPEIALKLLEKYSR